jgi:hypothetical protein
MVIDQQAVKKPDDEYYRIHPDLVDINAQRIAINSSDPNHQKYVEEWMHNYRQNVSQHKMNKMSNGDNKLGGTVEACPNTKKKPCCFRKITISCDHTKINSKLDAAPRKYKLILPVPPNNKKPLEYHVIAGESTSDTITVMLDADSCKNGHQDRPCVATYIDEERVGHHKELQFEVYCDKLSIMENWRDYLWPLDKHPKVYEVFAEACQGVDNASAIVKVYPDVAWDIKVMFNFGGNSKIDELDSHEKYSLTKKAVDKGIVIPSAKLTYNEHTTELSWDFIRSVEDKLEMINAIREFRDTVGPVFSEIGNLEISIDYPNIGFNYTYKTVEIEDDYGTDYSYSLKFIADPLIRIKGETDILNWLLTVVTGPLKNFLIYLKERLSEGWGKKDERYVKADFGIKVSVSGEICGELNWEKLKKQAVKDARKEGNIDLSIPVSIEGVAELDGDIFVFSAGAGVKVGAKTAVGAQLYAAQDDIEPYHIYAQGQLRWEGITVYYSYYIHNKFKIASPPQDRMANRSDANLNMDKEPSTKCEIFPPKYWPEKPGKHEILGG